MGNCRPHHKIAQLIDAVAAVHQAGKFFFQFIHFVLVSPFSKYMPILYPLFEGKKAIESAINFF